MRLIPMSPCAGSLGASVASDGEFCPNAQRPSRFEPRSRKGGSTFLCDLEAAMSQVMLLPLAMARRLGTGKRIQALSAVSAFATGPHISDISNYIVKQIQ